MKNQISLLPLFALILVACAPQAPAAAFHVTEDDALTGAPESFLLSEAELEGSFTQSFATVERTNEMFAESEAYIEATNRINGAMIKFHRPVAGTTAAGPLYIINHVNVFATPEDAQLAFSPEWYAIYFDSIFESEVTEVSSLTEIGAEHLIWQDANGNIGLTVVYRNLLLYFTGPASADGTAQVEFFANLAKSHLAWIQAREQ